MKYSRNHCTGWSSEGEQEPGSVEEEATEVVVEEEEYPRIEVWFLTVMLSRA